MRWLPPLLSLLGLLAALLPALPGPSAAATGPGRTGSPDLAPPGVACQTLPPATPSPTPAPSPTPPLGVGPTPTPAPVPETAVDPLLEMQAANAATLLEACWNRGAWDAVARLVTPHFLETAFGIVAETDQERARALAALGLGPLRIESIGPVVVWSDGRGAFDVHYRRGAGEPEQAVAARWFLRASRGVVQFDEERLLLPPPLGDRVTVGVVLAGGDQPLRWASPAGEQVPAWPVIALHGANWSSAAQTVIVRDDSGRTLGLLTLPAHQQGDLVLLGLPPGTYRLLDPSRNGGLGWRVTDDE